MFIRQSVRCCHDFSVSVLSLCIEVLQISTSMWNEICDFFVVLLVVGFFLGWVGNSIQVVV